MRPQASITTTARASDRLGQVALAGARWAEEECVFPLGDEARGGELENERAIHFLVEIEIKIVERAIGIAKPRQLVPALEQPVLSAVQFVGHERRHEVDGRNRSRTGPGASGFRG